MEMYLLHSNNTTQNNSSWWMQMVWPYVVVEVFPNIHKREKQNEENKKRNQ